MLFKRDGAHGLDAPLSPNITPQPGFTRKTPMLKANGGDFPGDPMRSIDGLFDLL
jgi:hypothetical protein